MGKWVFSLLMVVSSLTCSSATNNNSITDLSSIDFTQQGLHSIAGSWQFYWNQLIAPKDFDAANRVGELMEVPGGWNRDGKYPPLGFATYRLRLILPKSNSGLIIHFPVINCAAKIWINGTIVSESGIANADRNIYLPKLAETEVEVPLNNGELDIIIHVVNYTHSSGGFFGIPKIGKISQVLAHQRKMQGIENFLAGSLIAMFIYQFILFVFHRDKSSLWLSFICLGIALRTMTVYGGSLLLPNLFPNISWEIWKKIEFISVYSLVSLFPLYVFHTFQKNSSLSWPIRSAILLSFLLCLTVLTMPEYMYRQLLIVSHLALLFFFGYSIYSINNARSFKKKYTTTIFVGLLTSLPFIVAEIFKNYLNFPESVQSMPLAEIGILIFLLFQVYLLTNNYATVSREFESINLNLEAVVADRTAKLMTANHVKDRLLSVLSHDIKSPLNSLSGILNLYNSRFISPDEFKNFAKVVETDLNRTRLLVDNILYWTTSQLEGTHVKLEEFLVNDILLTNVKLFETIASKKGLTIINRVVEKYPICFDRNILDLTIRNLISNAIKFSNSGCEIIVECEENHGELAIRVTDFGVGMTQQVLKSLQNPEQRKSTNGTSNEKGTGLGLLLCRDYLRLAGGRLSIESTPSVGSVLTILIPSN